MAARDDYPEAAVEANWGPEVTQAQREIEAMFDEIDRLRGEIKARDKIDREVFGCD